MSHLRQRAPRIQSKSHLAFIRDLPCMACACEGLERFGVDAAHVRHAFPGWSPVGGGQKPDDSRVVPLCRVHHTDQHRENERVWYARLGVNPVSLCADLVEAYPSTFNGREVILDHAARARRPVRLVEREGGLTEAADAAPRSITIAAHLSASAPDADGNVAVVLSLAAGNTAIAHVAPDTISRDTFPSERPAALAEILEHGTASVLAADLRDVLAALSSSQARVEEMERALARVNQMTGACILPDLAWGFIKDIQIVVREALGPQASGRGS